MWFHKFTLTYNKLSKGLCIFGVLSEERVLPPTGERGPSSACSPDPECSTKMLLWRDSSQSGPVNPQNLHSLGLTGCWTLLVVVVLLRSLESRDEREVEIQAPAGADTAAAVEKIR